MDQKFELPPIAVTVAITAIKAMVMILTCAASVLVYSEGKFVGRDVFASEQEQRKTDNSRIEQAIRDQNAAIAELNRTLLQVVSNGSRKSP